jgi:hypothetical protein
MQRQYRLTHQNFHLCITDFVFLCNDDVFVLMHINSTCTGKHTKERIQSEEISQCFAQLTHFENTCLKIQWDSRHELEHYTYSTSS